MSEEYVGELVFEQGTPIPSLDMNQPIVRCRDCKNHIDTPKRGCRCYRWMTLDCYENPVPSEVNPDGFCAWGERRAE